MGFHMQAFYNLLFTSLPVIVVGLFDQDVSKVSTHAVYTEFLYGWASPKQRPEPDHVS